MTKEERLQLVQLIKKKYLTLSPHTTEKSRRIWAGIESENIGYRGKGIVHEATGLSYPTITKGCKESKESATPRIRKPGGGRKSKLTQDPTIEKEIEHIVGPDTLGDPEGPLLWVSKSLRTITALLKERGKNVSYNIVAQALKNMDYSLQGNYKTKEGSSHPDRDAQFQFINKSTLEFQAKKQPVISIDAKKKENIGNFKNNGKTYRPKGKPEEVEVYDFVKKDLGKVAPYGVYDVTENNGWVSVGISRDTAPFAVNSIRSWWFKMGKERYPDAVEIYITADSGGSNGNRVKLFKKELQALADELQMTIHVSHLPPGTSKWNKIEHKMFSFISINWKGRPLISRATVINLIGNTKTKTGLTIKAELDETEYKTGIRVKKSEFKKINLVPNDFHGEWNYKIIPNYLNVIS